MDLGDTTGTMIEQHQPISYGCNRPLRASKFSKHKQLSQSLADVPYENAIVVKMTGAEDPTKSKVTAILSVICGCEMDAIAMLPFRHRMYITLFMEQEQQEERAQKAFDKKGFKYRSIHLTFEPFQKNMDSVKNPLRHRVILALEGVPPKSWTSEAIAELLDNSRMIEEIYGERHIQDLSVFRLAA